MKQVAEFVAEADDYHRRASHLLDVRLTELWVGGAILQDAERIDTYDVVLVLDAPAGEVTWLASHPGGAYVADRLRLTKNLANWHLRSNEHNVHNHRLRELARVWTPEGPDEALLDRLRRGELTSVDVSSPPDDTALTQQLEVELAQCRQHLATVLDSYHDREWRRTHKANGFYPDDHLWRAAQAVRELTDARADLRP